MSKVLGFLNHCVTHFGRRELQQWILFPLFSRKSIIARQVAIRNLMALSDVVDSARQKMRKLPDLVRACTLVGAFVCLWVCPDHTACHLPDVRAHYC